MSTFTITCLVFSALSLGQAIRFIDVSRSAGLDHSFGPRLKFGGASVADLDGDGHPDLLLGHHGHYSIEVYFNNGNGTFTRSNFRLTRDVHALTAYRHRPTDIALRFAVSRGGLKNYPFMYQVDKDRAIQDVSSATGVKSGKGRGRNAAFLNLRPGSTTNPDVIFSNAKKWKGSSHHVAMVGFRNGQFSKSSISEAFAKNTNWYVATADVNGDKHMEVLSMQDLTAYRVSGRFKLTDISATVFPKDVPRYGTVAIAELDYDNDGRMDLFVARTATADLEFLKRRENFQDFLFRGVKGGGYEDKTAEAGIPSFGDSRGVTVGDFNNDGWTDILILRQSKTPVLLLNKGDGKFRQTTTPWRRFPYSARGDMAVAVDYDQDGRLDAVVSQGDYYVKRHAGYFRIFRNVFNGRFRNAYVLLRVGSSPRKRASSMHALVTVHLPHVRILRRVGSPGTAVSASYIETVHIGLGKARAASKITVRWIDGAIVTRRGVRAGSRLEVGYVPK